MTTLAETSTTPLYCNACASRKGKCTCLAAAAEFLGDDRDCLVALSHRGQLLTTMTEQRFSKARLEAMAAIDRAFRSQGLLTNSLTA